LPAEITQANGRVAEVRLVCDNCGQLIGTSLMPKSQAEDQVASQVVCQHCREVKDSKKKTKN